jgi:hypothetical protein
MLNIERFYCIWFEWVDGKNNFIWVQELRWNASQVKVKYSHIVSEVSFINFIYSWLISRESEGRTQLLPAICIFVKSSNSSDGSNGTNSNAIISFKFVAPELMAYEDHFFCFARAMTYGFENCIASGIWNNLLHLRSYYKSEEIRYQNGIRNVTFG